MLKKINQLIIKMQKLKQIYFHYSVAYSWQMMKRQENILYVQEVVTQPKILNRTILYNLVHVT